MIRQLLIILLIAVFDVTYNLYAQDSVKSFVSVELGKSYMFRNFSKVNAALEETNADYVLANHISTLLVNRFGIFLSSEGNISQGLSINLDLYEDSVYFLESYGFQYRFLYPLVEAPVELSVGGSMGVDMTTIRLTDSLNIFIPPQDLVYLLGKRSNRITLNSAELLIGPMITLHYMFDDTFGLYAILAYTPTIASSHFVNQQLSNQIQSVDGFIGIGFIMNLYISN